MDNHQLTDTHQGEGPREEKPVGALNSRLEGDNFVDDNFGDDYVTDQSFMSPRNRFIVRLIIGVLWGVGLYSFNRSGFFDDSSEQVLFARLIISLAPIPFLVGIGNIPLRRLIIWEIIAIILLVIVGLNISTPIWNDINGFSSSWLFSLIILYILHEFVQAYGFNHKQGEKFRIFAPYPVYFNLAWHHGIQAGLGLAFLGAFWAVFALGAWMFKTIGIAFFLDLFEVQIFVWVASTTLFAIALHLTDAGARLTQGARQLALTLLSWLSIFMTLILTGFLVALCFTGLEKLWNTGYATAILLNAAAVMILLINAAFQAGELPKSGFIRNIVRFSALPLLGVVALAGLGLWLRVNQYGLTPARVIAGAQLLVVSFYGIGYLIAALKPGRWMELIKPVNIAGAIFVAAVLFLLLIPVGSPAKLSVHDQVTRLENGKVEPDDFDFSFLSNRRTGKYGKKALEDLKNKSGNARNERIALLANNSDALKNNYSSGNEVSHSDRRDAIRLITENADWNNSSNVQELADSIIFKPQNGEDIIGRCLEKKLNFEKEIEEEKERDRKNKKKQEVQPADQTPLTIGGRCPARFVDLDFDGDLDLLIWFNHRIPLNDLSGSNRFRYDLVVYEQLKPNQWKYSARSSSDMPEKLDYLSRKDFKEFLSVMREQFLTMKVIPAKDKSLLVDIKKHRIKRLGFQIEDARLKSALTVLDKEKPPEEIFINAINFTNPLLNCIAESSKDFSDSANTPKTANESPNKNLSKCYGRYLDIDEDGQNEFGIFVFSQHSTKITLYREINERWAIYGTVRFPALIKSRNIRANDLETLQQDFVKDITVTNSQFGDLAVGNRVIKIYPLNQD